MWDLTSLHRGFNSNLSLYINYSSCCVHSIISSNRYITAETSKHTFEKLKHYWNKNKSKNKRSQRSEQSWENDTSRICQTIAVPFYRIPGVIGCKVTNIWANDSKSQAYVSNNRWTESINAIKGVRSTSLISTYKLSASQREDVIFYR